MKKLNVKTIGIAAAAAAMLALAGCGENNTASLPQESLPAQNIAAPQETAGTLLLSVNPAIELDYDMAGDVVRLNALNDDAKAVLAGYDSYYGRSAAEAPEIDGKIFFTSSRRPYMGEYLQVRLTDMMDIDLLGENAEDSEAEGLAGETEA